MNTQVFPPQPVFAHIQSPYSHVNQSAHVHLFEIVVYKDKSLSQCILMDTTKDATKPRKIPWPANIYILLENSRIRNLEMSMMSVKKILNKILDCWNILIHVEILKKLFWSMLTHMPAPKHLWNKIISSRSWQLCEIERAVINLHIISL